MVLQDGNPILRGQDKAQAVKVANDLAQGLTSKRGGSRIHSPHIEIRYDERAMENLDNLYTEFKGYRNGD